MRRLISIAAISIVFAAGLTAAPGGVIQTRDGKTRNAISIDTDSITFVSWVVERGQPVVRIRPWELESLRFNGMDDFNSLARKLAGRRAEQMMKDARWYLAEEPKQGFSKADWEYHVRNACRYYVAQGHLILKEYDQAILAFETFFDECEKSAVPGGVPQNYTSAITKKSINNPGGLHRMYLDGLEAYIHCLLLAGRVDDAKGKGIKSLQDLTTQMARADREYHAWTMRALRALASHAEDRKDYASAREAYASLYTVSLSYGGSKPNRASMEAQLKGGYMAVREGDTRRASSVFVLGIREWEKGQRAGAETTSRSGWVDSDQAYLTAGCYVGQGMVDAHEAGKDKARWGKALQNFSIALSVFRSDDEIRSMALLGAANACAQLADLSTDTPGAAGTHARTAEKYLAELQNLLPKSKAAQDESIAAIQKLIQVHKKE